MNAPFEQVIEQTRAARADVNECLDALDAPSIYPNVSCSQCGRDFGPGPHGFSHCESHMTAAELDRKCVEDFFFDFITALPVEIAATRCREEDRVHLSPQWRTLSAPARIAAEWAMDGVDAEPDVNSKALEEARRFWHAAWFNTDVDDDVSSMALNARSNLDGLLDRIEEEASAERAHRRYVPNALAYA